MTERRDGDRDFHRYLWGRLALEVGNRISREGLPLVAILAAGATAPQLGLLAALTMLPSVVLGPPVGAWTDRRRRQPILVAAAGLRSALLLTIPVAAWLHHLSFALVATVAVGEAAAALCFGVADRAYLPTVAPGSLLGANSLLSGAEAVGETTGPTVLGALVQWLGAPLAMVWDALGSLVAAVLLAAIRRPEPRPAATPGAGATRWSDGLGVLAGQPVLRVLAAVLMGESFFGGFSPRSMNSMP